MWNKFQCHSKNGPCEGMNLSSGREPRAHRSNLDRWVQPKKVDMSKETREIKDNSQE